MIRDLIQIVPTGYVDADLRKLKRMWRQHGQQAPLFFMSKSEKRRQKRQRNERARRKD